MELDVLIKEPGLAGFEAFIEAALTGLPGGLSPEERLIAGFIYAVDPRMYYGSTWNKCLVGQLGTELRRHRYEVSVSLVASWSGVSTQRIQKIFDGTCFGRQHDDYHAAIEFAAETLSVDLERVLPIFHGKDNYTMTKARS